MPKLTVTIEIDLGNKGFRSDPDRWHSFFEENRSRSCDSLKACVMKKIRDVVKTQVLPEITEKAKHDMYWNNSDPYPRTLYVGGKPKRRVDEDATQINREEAMAHRRKYKSLMNYVTIMEPTQDFKARIEEAEVGHCIVKVDGSFYE